MSFLKKARKERKKRINAIHEDLNTVVMDLYAIVRADDEVTKQNIMARALLSMRDAKRGMVDLGLEYQG
ncbi:hypothetical protein [Desulforegula conservatrix]|uniref:hypothetical protein n=1 Tax=Desulforegula conservatrix TaxID=153026 RepID=UPI0003F88948|nr:hypothetical protein [Desulforegula conservatrix]